jgi:hypothetical protein
VTSPLKSPRLRRILVAYTVNRLGNWFGLVALSLAVFDHTHSAMAVAALLLAWQALPALVIPAVIVRVEASQRGSELSGLYFFEAMATAALAVLLWQFWLPAILLLAAFDGTAALAANSLLRAELARAARDEAEADGLEDGKRAVPDLEDKAHEAERKANAALNMAFSAAFVLGPVLGGVVVAAAGAPAALYIDVVSFLICGGLLLNLHSHVEEVGDDSVRARLGAAWKHINEAPSLRALLLAEAVAFIFFNAASPIEVAYAKTTLHAGDRGFGLLLTSWGAGAVIGSLLFARSLRRPLGTLLSVGTLGVGMAYVGFSAAPSLVLACGGALIGGVGNGMELPSLFSIVQGLTPKNLHGRLMGAIESLTALCPAIGLPLGGALVTLTNPRTAFLVAGLGTVAAAAVLFRFSGRGITRADDSDMQTRQANTQQGPASLEGSVSPVSAGDS